MEIADDGTQVAPLNVTGPALEIQQLGLVKEDAETLCLTSMILGLTSSPKDCSPHTRNEN